MMSFELSRAQRQALLAGDCPAIHGPGKCPLELGQVYELSDAVSVRVLRIDPRQGGGWKLHYELRRKIEDRRLLRRTPPVSVPRGGSLPTPETIRKAAEESAYTERLTGLVADAGEAVEASVQERFGREGQQDRVRRMADYERSVRERPLHDQLFDALEEARAVGVDTARYEARIRDGIEALRKRTRRDAA